MYSAAQHYVPSFNARLVVITSGVASLIEQGQFNPSPYLLRHLAADWGDLSDNDRHQNDDALKSGEDRLFSAYEVGPNLKVWVITEWDRSVTTVLLPSEY